MDINTMSLEEIWRQIEVKINEKPDLIQNMKATYLFHITGKDDNIYSFVIKEAKAEVINDKISADCTFIMNEENFKKLLKRNLNAATAYMTGKLKIKGNISLALKLESLLKNLIFKLEE